MRENINANSKPFFTTISVLKSLASALSDGFFRFGMRAILRKISQNYEILYFGGESGPFLKVVMTLRDNINANSKHFFSTISGLESLASALSDDFFRFWMRAILAKIR